MTIDAVVPFHAKDGSTIRSCIEGIKKNLDVARVLVVCNSGYRSVVESTGAVFFDEDRVVEGLTCKSLPNDRWGWYFQQILKLGMADWVETEYYLVVDADTVFLRAVPFFDDSGRPLYATGTEYHQPYFEVFEEMLGHHANREYSFIVHHMVFNREIVREMRDAFCEQPWYSSIVSHVDPQQPWFSGAQFSEYETYGHYLKYAHPGQVNVRPLQWANVSVEPSPKSFMRLARHYDFCTFHAHMREDSSLRKRVGRRVRFERMMLRACVSNDRRSQDNGST